MATMATVGAGTALVGQEFGQGVSTYKVLDVFWSALRSEPLVLFYNVDMHTAAEEAAIREDPSGFEHAFTSLAADVCAWAEAKPVASV